MAYVHTDSLATGSKVGAKVDRFDGDSRGRLLVKEPQIRTLLCGKLPPPLSRLTSLSRGR